VESVKAVSDIYAPVSGAVTEVNVTLADSPEMINEDPYGDAWMIRVAMSDPSEHEDLLTAEEYKKFIEEEQQEED
jgi:glycine cleavage system H protein